MAQPDRLGPEVRPTWREAIGIVRTRLSGEQKYLKASTEPAFPALTMSLVRPKHLKGLNPELEAEQEEKRARLVKVKKDLAVLEVIEQADAVFELTDELKSGSNYHVTGTFPEFGRMKLDKHMDADAGAVYVGTKNITGTGQTEQEESMSEEDAADFDTKYAKLLVEIYVESTKPAKLPQAE